MSEVLYARVPEETKAAAGAFATAHGWSVATAVAELLGRGLRATSDAAELAEFRDRLERTELALAQKDVELREAGLALERLEQREAERNTQLQAFQKRAGQNVGTCPRCHTRISGYDVLISGRCPSEECGKGLTAALMAPEAEAPGLDRQEVLLLLAALGVVAGTAWLTSRS